MLQRLRAAVITFVIIRCISDSAPPLHHSQALPIPSSTHTHLLSFPWPFVLSHTIEHLLLNSACCTSTDDGSNSSVSCGTMSRYDHRQQQFGGKGHPQREQVERYPNDPMEQTPAAAGGRFVPSRFAAAAAAAAAPPSFSPSSKPLVAAPPLLRALASPLSAPLPPQSLWSSIPLPPAHLRSGLPKFLGSDGREPEHKLQHHIAFEEL